MDLFTYLLGKNGKNTHRDLFSYLLGKNAGGSGTYTTFSGTSLNISNTLQAKIKNIALEGNTSQDGDPTPDAPIPIKVVTGEQNVEISGKNLFDKDNDVTLKTQASFTETEDNEFTKSTSNIRTLIIIRVPSNSEITLSINNDNYIQSRYFISQLKTPTIEAGKNERWYTGNSTIVTTDKTNYLGIVLEIKNNGTTVYSTQESIDEMNIQIEEGTIATSYVPYQSQTYPLSLVNIELAKIGNYKDYIFKNELGSPYYNADLDLSEWYYSNLFTKINSYNGETIITPYISTTGGLDIGATIYYYNNSNVPIKITDTTLILQLENINNNAHSYKDTTIIECTSASTDNETIVFSGDIKVTSVGLGNSLNTSLLSSNLQNEEPLSLDNTNEDEIEEPIENEEVC